MSTINLSEQIDIYGSYERPIYEKYCRLLTGVLELIKKEYRMEGEVSGRTKEIVSFAEKCVRKADKYPDPVYDLTDLCGVRVVAKTQTEVNRFCRMIESLFIIDEANSENKLDLLKEQEFGYLSVHYIVQVPSDLGERFPRIRDLGVPIDEINQPRQGEEEPRFRKAEIQVRTLLQHQWADSFHDRIYKNAIQLPKNYKREANQLAAIMESADKAYTGLVEKIDAFVYDLGAYLDDERLKKEIETLGQVIGFGTDEDKGKVALRIAKMARARRDWETVCSTEQYLAKAGDTVARELYCEVAIGLCHTAAAPNEDDEKWKRGKDILEEIAAPVVLTEQEKEECKFEGQEMRIMASKLSDSKPDDDTRDIVRARAMAAYAWAVKKEQTGLRILQEQEHRDLLYQAHLLDPSDPIAFSLFIDGHFKANRQLDFCVLMWPSIEKAIARCRELVAAGAEIAQSLFAMARLYLFTDRVHDALMSLTKAIARCTNPSELFEELELIDELHQAARNPMFKKEVGKARSLLIVGVLSKRGGKDITQKTKGRYSLNTVHDLKAEESVLIIAGGTDPHFASIYAEYRPCIRAALEGFRGAAFSGGTDAGIPGIVGDEFLDLGGEATPSRLLGLLPKYMRWETFKSHSAYEVRTTDGDSISHTEMIQYWADIIEAGIQPHTVKLLGINGGTFCEFEYALATALGATTGIIEKSGRKADEFLNDPFFTALPTTIPLPKDPMTIKAFVMVSKADIEVRNVTLEDGTTISLEPMAKKVHANYVESATSKPPKWEDSPTDFKRSCFHQVMFTLASLGNMGLRIDKLDQNDPALVTDVRQALGDKLDYLAQLEHGRWNVERLLMGWRYGFPKDVSQKRNPSLIDWESLSPDVQQWDYDPWIKLPGTLKEMGLGIYV